MTFIATLLSLIIERFFYWGHLRRWRWFARYQAALSTRIGSWSSYVLLFISVGVPVLLTGFIGYILSGWLFGLLNLIFSILILLYCLGPSNLWAQVYPCISELNKEDPKIAVEKVRSAFGIPLPENSQRFHQLFVNGIFTAAYYRIFAVVFWFILLGPAGALLYRLIMLSQAESVLGLSRLAGQVQDVMDWVPVRLFTFLFALGGHFTEVFATWKKSAAQGLKATEAMLTKCGVAALDVLVEGKVPEDGAAEKEAVELLDRVFVIGLVVLAVIILVL